MTAGLRERATQALAVRELVRRLATLLAAAGIEAVLLKGALLQQAVYDDPAERPVNDLDLLVGAADFERVFRVPGSRFVVDLHRELFFPGQFRLRGREVIARARQDTKLFDAPLLVPDPYDLYAHLFGHFVLAWLTTRELHHPRDFERVARRFQLEARRCAETLARCGMARAAHYALPLLGDPFSLEVLQALPPDPLATPLARLVRAIVPRLPANRGVGLLAPKLLHRSPSSAARAIAGGAYRRVRRRLRYSP